MAAKGIHCLPVTDKSLILQMVFAQTHARPFTYSYTRKHAPQPVTLHPTHAVGLKRFMIIPFDLRVWRTSAIRLYYDQGYPGTCLLV